MNHKIRGRGLRVTGLVLGIVGAAAGITAIVFSALGMHQARLCKHCAKGANFR